MIKLEKSKEWIDLPPNTQFYQVDWEPGFLVKLDNDNIELIGHMNLQSGYCGCCGDTNQVVLAYKYVL